MVPACLSEVSQTLKIAHKVILLLTFINVQVVLALDMPSAIHSAAMDGIAMLRARPEYAARITDLTASSLSLLLLAAYLSSQLSLYSHSSISREETSSSKTSINSTPPASLSQGSTECHSMTSDHA